MVIIVDSDGLIGSINPTDAHHKTSQKILNALVNKQARLIYPATTIVETVTFLQGRLNSPQLAAEITELATTNAIEIETVDSHILKKAAEYMNFKQTKHNTLFDAIVAAIAHKHKADAIFSFDNFYKKKGFKLASEVIK